ncbi:hypothetical protein BGZ65_009157, partial [Modicella reniformis]
MEGYSSNINDQHLQEHHLQELCLYSSEGSLTSPEIVAIPARWDVKTRHYVVLLNEAQQIFKNAVHFLDNGYIVPFVKEDDDSQAIKYHPGVVLEVVQMDAGQGGSGGTGLNAPRSCDTAGNSDRDAFVNAAQAISVRSPLLAHIKRYGSHIEAMISSEARRASGIQNTMNQLLKIMRHEISEDKSFHQFLQMKQSLQDRKETQSGNLQLGRDMQLERDISEKQQQILQAQMQNIDHLVTIQ